MSSAILAVLRPRLPEPNTTMRCEDRALYRLISEWAALAPMAPAISHPAKDIPRSRAPAATMSRSYFISHDRS